MAARPPELTGRVALVTGAARNIGRAIALALAEAGAAVAVNTRASREDAEETVKLVQDAGATAALYMADITDPHAVNAMVDRIVERHGRLDILVLNASVREERSFLEMTYYEWRRVMSLTLDGAFHCTKACLPHILRAGGGSIVTLGGDTALSGAGRKPQSAVAKNGLIGMTRALAREFADRGIRVNCVSPGHIETTRPGHRSARPVPDGLIPMARHGVPGDIAATVRFLCGPGGAYITGQTISVNGGMLMR
jgi:3-oxoacyl-[acyl-carrier protein] reductase